MLLDIAILKLTKRCEGTDICREGPLSERILMAQFGHAHFR